LIPLFYIHGWCSSQQDCSHLLLHVSRCESLSCMYMYSQL
jgi:hypothetical protein